MGPLAGTTVIELQGIGPGPFCGMMLADMGADVIRIDRAAAAGQPPRGADILARGRRSVAVDLKNADGVETVLTLLEQADVLIEGFRPGVMERLGLGPDVCLSRNPGLVYGRMTDGSALLMNGVFGGMNTGHWKPERGSNTIDGGAHFYGTYETADGKYISIGSIEPQFYALLLEKSGLGEQDDLPRQHDRDAWPAMRARLAGIFRQRTRDEWDEIMLGTDICYAPILEFSEAVEHPHNQARATFVEVDGIRQAAPAPRFSRSEVSVPAPAVTPGQHTDAVLEAFGFDPDRISALRASGAVAG